MKSSWDRHNGFIREDSLLCQFRRSLIFNSRFRCPRENVARCLIFIAIFRIKAQLLTTLVREAFEKKVGKGENTDNWDFPFLFISQYFLLL